VAYTARGNNFKDEKNPRAVVQVGKAGEIGSAEISDMLFETGEVLPGATLIEFNLKPAYQGAVGMWDSVIRVGGAASTGKVVTDCNACKAAFMNMHVTRTGSGYFENLWLWTADHAIDQAGGQSISAGRGLLVESTDPTWLVALGVEHNALYGYNVVNARNVFFGLIQVESPYWQPAPGAPSGWEYSLTVTRTLEKHADLASQFELKVP
jgi:glucan 1,3-beta-glucosidase